MKNSLPQISYSQTRVPENETPFSQEYVRLTKQEHIKLKHDVAYWKKQHERAVERLEKQEQAFKEKLEMEQKLSAEREELLKKEFEKAQGEIRDLRQRLYGTKTETKASPRSDKEFEGTHSSNNRGQQPGSKGHGRTQRPDFPVDGEELDLSGADACCPNCHKPFIPTSMTENSDFIEIKVRAYTRRIKRKIYKPGCQCPNLPGLITPPPPPRLLSRNNYGVSVWSDVLLDKFLYARPTYRLLQYYKTIGLHISQGTITDGLKRLAPVFEPLVKAMHEKQMTESLFWGDETRWMVFEIVEGKIGYRWYLWVMISKSVFYYVVATGRGANVPKDHFKTLNGTTGKVIMICDRYSAYKKMAKDMPIFLLAFCWAHVRRDFIDAARRFPEQKEWMFDWVKMIRELFRINKMRIAVWDEEKPLEQQSPAFQEQHKALENALSNMAERRDELLRQEDLPAPQKAVLSSLKSHWPGLTIFVAHPEVPMDNNKSERAVRKGVNGRKNYNGSGSHWSAILMAGMFTLLQTILHWGIDPRHWLIDFLNACAANGGKSPSDLSPFLPWEMDEDRKRFLSQPLSSDDLNITEFQNTS
jgi:transposase